MPTPYSGTEASVLAKVQDGTAPPVILALSSGGKWGGPLGTGANLTYSFAKPPATPELWSTASEQEGGYGPPEGGREPWARGFAALTEAQRIGVEAALQSWADVANIRLARTDESPENVGDLRFATSDYTPRDFGVAGHTQYPARGASAGDVWMAPADQVSHNGNPTAGSYGYYTLLHEIGHALGLKHSFQGKHVLEANFDRHPFTVMSYTRTDIEYEEIGTSSIHPTTPMVLDVFAIQYIYGPNMAHRTGDDLYQFEQGRNYYQTIWDAGGTDTIAYTGSDGCAIDLRAGNFSQLGNPINVARGVVQHDNVAIALNCIIENARAGAGDDVLTGNTAANLLEGGAGQDVLRGDEGNDTLDGSDGDDLIRGGAGTDLLRGGAGVDRFVVTDSQDTVADLRPGDFVYLDIYGSVTGNPTSPASAEGLRVEITPGAAVVSLGGMNVRLLGDFTAQGFVVADEYRIAYDPAQARLAGSIVSPDAESSRAAFSATEQAASEDWGLWFA